jgi:acyl transferase domain-containing protein/acyl carrier protein
MKNPKMYQEHYSEAIAIIGMACRMPGARDVSEFWQNLCNGVQSITTFTEEELRASGVPSERIKSSHYVRRRGIIDGADQFDAAFFGFTPRDAELIDPQQRVLLECAWHALEDAGYVPEEVDARIGVFGGVGTNWHLSDVAQSSVAKKYASGASVVIGNDKDYVTTRISYKLGLVGPSVNVQSACSTSLVATILGMTSLRSNQCDLVLAGGATIELPERKGYLALEGGMESPDGNCRPFDASANGTVFSRGAGMVVLKRLADAVRDRDHIYAVLVDGAVNNDGADKIGFTAPSISGQVALTLDALSRAGLSAEQLSFVEAHGTATPLGDPIEVESLTQAFRHYSDHTQFCALGSVKGNIGHTDVASGVAALIKAAKTVEERLLPPSLGFAKPNPNIDFSSSPLFVNTKLRKLVGEGTPVRGLVSSFGVGGTNACVVIQEPPTPGIPKQAPEQNIAVLSARTEEGLRTQIAHLSHHLTKHPDLDLAAMACTLQMGRRRFKHRCAIPFANRQEFIERLNSPDGAVIRSVCQREGEPITFLFPGQGNQFVGMGANQYRLFPAFREVIDRGSEFLKPMLGVDLRDLLFPPADEKEKAKALLDQTYITQPVLFLVNYAQAMLWRAWGLEADVMIGHSVGEYVAACIAGVFSFEDGLTLVSARARLIQDLPGGSMLAVLLPEAELSGRLPRDVEVAAVNSRKMTVVSGPDEAIKFFEIQLAQEKVFCRHLNTSHAFHSAMTEPAMGALARRFVGISLSAPTIPIVSTLTGVWLTDEEACDPHYWVRHMREPVRFVDALDTLLATEESYIFLECGPGYSLASSVKSLLDRSQHDRVICSQQGMQDVEDDLATVTRAVGSLWATGRPIDWKAFYADGIPGRVSLPGYPFDRQSFALDFTTEKEKDGDLGTDPSERKTDLGDWFYELGWTGTAAPGFLAPPAAEASPQTGCWLLFDDNDALYQEILTVLEGRGEEIVRVEQGSAFATSKGGFVIRPAVREDYDQLLTALKENNQRPTRILHLWNSCQADDHGWVDDPEAARILAFDSPMYLEQALIAQGLPGMVRLLVVTRGVHSVAGEPIWAPLRALAAGPCRVVAKEFPTIQGRMLDVSSHPDLAFQLVNEAELDVDDTVVVYRGGRRFIESWHPLRLPPGEGLVKTLKAGGTYLITGGLGALGLFFSKIFAETVPVNLVLVSRSTVPPRENWEMLLESSDCHPQLRDRLEQLLAIETAGGKVMIAQADVTDLHRMKEVVNQVYERFGKIDGVIHSAGNAGGGIIALKTPEMAREVLEPKVQGTRVIERLFGDRDLDFIWLFSSVTAVLGEAGRVDYCAANSYIDAVAQSWNQKRPGLFRSLGWAAWAEIGMASRWEDAKAKRQSGKRVQRVEAGDWLRLISSQGHEELYEVLIDPEADWIITEHLVSDTPTLVGASFPEFLWRFAAQRHPGEPVQIKNAYFIAPMMFTKGEQRRLMLVVKGQEGRYKFSFRSRPADSPTVWQDHFMGDLVLTGTEPRQQNLEMLLAKFPQMETNPYNSLDVTAEDGTPLLTYSERWRTLSELAEVDGNWLAKLQLDPKYGVEFATFLCHPALLDVALACGSFRMAFSGEMKGWFYLPYCYKQLKLWRPIPPVVWSQIRLTSPYTLGADTISFDVTVLDASGEICVEVEGFILKKVDIAAPLLKSSAASVPGEEVKNEDITPKEALDLLNRLLEQGGRHGSTAPMEHLLITTKDLAWQIADGSPRVRAEVIREQMSAPANTVGQIFSRDDLLTPYQAPANEIETAIAEIWQGILGIQQIGVNDQFAELGGNSLLAIQMIAITSETFQIDLAVDSFFKEPTIRGLAEVVIKQLIAMTDPEILEALISQLED